MQQDPVGSVDTARKVIAGLGGDAYITKPRSSHQVDAAGDFSNYTHNHWLGVRGDDPNPVSANEAATFFKRGPRTLREIYVNPFAQPRWQDASWSDVLPAGANYRGAWDSNAEALSHMQVDGDVYFHPGSDKIRQVSNFVAGQVVHTEYDTERLATIDEIPPPLPRDFERVPTLPEATATSEDLVFLTHKNSRGTRADAVLTVGFDPDSSIVGFSSGELRPEFGSLTIASPIVEILGFGSTADYFLESIYTFDEPLIDELAEMWIAGVMYTLSEKQVSPNGQLFSKRIINYPESLAAATLAINYRRTEDFDSTFYYTDGSLGEDERGLYQKETDGSGGLLYERLSSPRVEHIDGVGAPATTPRRAGTIYIDDIGTLYASFGQHRILLTAAGGSSMAWNPNDETVGDYYVPAPVDFAELLAMGGNGAFYWVREVGIANFPQFQGPDLTDRDLVNTWLDVWNYIISVENSTATRAIRDSVFLGGFASLEDALDEMDARLGGTPADLDNIRYYYGDQVAQGDTTRLRQIITFTPGAALRVEDFGWQGPFTTAKDVRNAIDDAIDDAEAPLLAHIEPWALIASAPGLTPGMLDIGGFTQAEIDAIPLGGSADFFYRGRVLKDPDGTLAYVGGGWQERMNALGFVFLTQAEYDALPVHPRRPTISST